MRRSLSLAAILTVCLSVVATANVAPGRYTGHLGSSPHGAKVTFTVAGGSLKNFHAFVPAYCVSTGTFVFDTFIVPKARIRSGKVRTTYVVRDDHGAAIGRDRLTATFRGRRATGTLGGSYTGCTIATYHWTAHR